VRRLALLAALGATSAAAQELPPQMGRYLPLFPGMYAHASYGQDPRDASFDQSGEERPTAMPTMDGHTALPEDRSTLAFLWHFPMFETYGIPFVSSTTHLARATFAYAENDTHGALADFHQSERGQDRDMDEADDLRDTGRGIGDVLVEFGSYL
jgi:hypothetical protein